MSVDLEAILARIRQALVRRERLRLDHRAGLHGRFTPGCPICALWRSLREG